MTSVLQSAVFNLWLGARVLEPGLSIARLGDVSKSATQGVFFIVKSRRSTGIDWQTARSTRLDLYLVQSSRLYEEKPVNLK